MVFYCASYLSRHFKAVEEAESSEPSVLLQGYQQAFDGDDAIDCPTEEVRNEEDLQDDKEDLDGEGLYCKTSTASVLLPRDSQACQVAMAQYPWRPGIRATTLERTEPQWQPCRSEPLLLG